MREAFRNVDRENAGRIGEVQFREAFSNLGLNGTAEQISNLFNVTDKHNAGVVDRFQFTNAVQETVRLH